MLLFLLPIIVTAQNGKRANIWKFGSSSGLDFSGGAPIPANVIPPTINAIEGSASICDTGGNLLFYTDGKVVWNKSNGIMGVGLVGGSSSTQAAFIAPYVSNPDWYYIFTTDGITTGAGGTWKGLNYTVVNMLLNAGNGGFVPGMINKQLVDSTSEKVTAIKHANGIDFWIITRKHFTNEWHAFLATCNGIDSSRPVISTIGSMSGGGRGYIKSSLDGKLILNAAGVVELFDFDNNSGQLSNGREISTDGGYGISMSPNDSLIYVSTNGTEIHQFQRYAVNISTTKQIFSITDFHGAIQLGPDGKIYIAQAFKDISVINNPNNISSPNITERNVIVNTGFGNCIAGLPNVFDHLAYGEPLSYVAPDTQICKGSSIMIGSDSAAGIQYRWSPTTGLNDTTISNPLASPDTTTVYIVKVFSSCDTIFDTIIVQVNPTPDIELGNDTSLCAGINLIIGNSVSGVDYLWSSGDTVPYIPITSSGTYILNVMTAKGCSDSDSISVQINPTPNIELGNDIDLCAGINLITGDSVSGVDYLWSTGDTVPYILITSSGTYILNVITAKGCSDSDSITIQVNPTPDIELKNDTSLCTGVTLTIGDSTSSVDYLWSTGDTTPFITTTSSGIYILTVITNKGCMDIDSITIQFSSYPSLSILFSDSTICLGESLMLLATSNNPVNYQWLPTEDLNDPQVPNPRITPNTNTVYQLIVTDSCSLRDTAQITIDVRSCNIFVPIAFSPNGDGVNDVFEIRGDGIIYLTLSIYDRWGHLIFETDDINKGWDGLENKQEANEGVYVYILRATMINGQVINQKGNISLIR